MADANPNSNDDFEKMLRAILGDEAADQILNSMPNGFPSGITGSENGDAADSSVSGLPSGMEAMMNPQNFQLIAGQIRQMLGSSGEGPVNWKIGEQVARQSVAHSGPGTPNAQQGEEARRALETASLWLDPVTEIGPVSGPVQVWSRLDFVAHCLPTFKRLTEPVGENIARAFSESMEKQLENAPEELRAMFSGMMGSNGGMLGQIISSILAVQYGGGLAQLAEVCFGTTDSGMPLVEGQTAALVPESIREFGEGLDIEFSELLLYTAVRETAAARLFSQVPWLRTRMINNVATFASEISIDTDAIEQRVREMNIDPQMMMSGQMPEIDLSDVFTLEASEDQQVALASLEHSISLVEGWVSAVTEDAVVAHLPSARKLAEIFVRRDATVAPFNQAFGPLVGFELSPRRVREATAFWRYATRERGQEGRDGLWDHPDFLPEPEDLDDPAAFFSGKADSPVEEELDAFLAQLLEGDDAADAPHEPGFGESKGNGGAEQSGGPEQQGNSDQQGGHSEQPGGQG